MNQYSKQLKMNKKRRSLLITNSKSNCVINSPPEIKIRKLSAVPYKMLKTLTKKKSTQIIFSKVKNRQVSKPKKLIGNPDFKVPKAKFGEISSSKRVKMMDYKTQFFNTNINMGILDNKGYLHRCRKIDKKIDHPKMFNEVYCSLKDIWKDKKIHIVNQLKKFKRISNNKKIGLAQTHR
mmetsp:Transcript_9007/g.8013  ORF Transcript_9007/g.8013 Transcript_9007/m.8013 type:complete len:179 (+) Transcript_9007:3-539(+)